jgi:hypothetical protein
MGLTFPTVPVIESGDEITASQIRAMADGFNARMRSGVADPTYRIQQYFLCMWRQIRTGADNVIPANSEFWNPTCTYLRARGIIRNRFSMAKAE